MSKVIVVTSGKGGVGKTTSTASLGAALAPAGDVWVLLAREDPPVQPGRVIADDLRYRWPLTGAERRAVRLTPGAPSPPPRAPSTP